MPVRDLLSAASSQGGSPSDPYFYDVSLLLNGDGTNGAQNNTFLDSSTNNFTITRNGNTTQGSFSPYGNLWSNYFNGSSFLSIASNSALALNNTFTIEAWVYLTANPSGTDGAYLTDFRGSSTNNYTLGFIGSGGVAKMYSYSAGAGLNLTGSTTVTLNTWHHVAYVNNSGTFTMYLDGVSQGSASSSYTQSATSLTIASRYTQNTEFITGYISNLRITNTAIYTSTFTPSTTPLTAISGTQLLTAQSNRFIDNSTNSLTITIGGSTSVQRFSPFNPTAPYSTSVIGGSGYFDGSSNLALASNAAFQPGTGDFTIEAFVNFSANNSMIIAVYSSGIAFYVKSTGYLAVAQDAVAELLVASTPFPLNSWNYVTLVRSGTTLTIYQNGISVGSTINVSNFTGSTVTVGSGQSVSQPANGYISDLRFVKGTAVYTSNFTPPTAPLTTISGTSLLTNMVNAGIPDLAMQNNLQTVGNAQVSTSVKKYGTGSLSFNGTSDYLYSLNKPQLTLSSSSPFTIEGWVYFNSVSSQQYILSNWSVGSNGYALATGVASFSNNQICFFDGTSWRAGSNTVSSGTWYHIAVSSSGSASGTYIYINGVSQVSGFTPASTINNATSLFIVGSYTNSGTSSLNGYVDDLRITNGYNRYPSGTTFTPPTSALPTY